MFVPLSPPATEQQMEIYHFVFSSNLHKVLLVGSKPIMYLLQAILCQGVIIFSQETTFSQYNDQCPLAA